MLIDNAELTPEQASQLRADVEAGSAILSLGVGGIASIRNVGSIKPQLIFRYTDEGLGLGANAPPKITIQDHYAHHKAMVDDVKEQLDSQGFRISQKEISFGDSCGTGRCRPDIVYEMPSGEMRIIEVKTGESQLSIRQSQIFPQIENGDAIPRGQVAADFNLTPGLALKDQGYPDGIRIEELRFPGIGQ